MGQRDETPGLEWEPDDSYQKREWRVQRVAWGMLLTFLVAGALGLTGPGVLSSNSVGDPQSGLYVRFNRFEHAQRPTEIVLRMKADGKEPQVGVSINAAFLRDVSVVRIEPEPRSQESLNGRVRYIFGTADAGEMDVKLTVEARVPVVARAEVRRDGEEAVTFWQAYFP